MVIAIMLAGILAGIGGLTLSALLFDLGWLALVAIYSASGGAGSALAAIALAPQDKESPRYAGRLRRSSDTTAS